MMKPKSGKIFDKRRYLQEAGENLRAVGFPVSAEYVKEIDAAWVQASTAAAGALSVIPRLLPVTRKGRLAVFKRVCARLDLFLEVGELPFENLITVFSIMDTFDRRYDKIEQAALRECAANGNGWLGISKSAAEFFKLHLPMIEDMRDEGPPGFFNELAPLSLGGILVFVLISQIYGGIFTTTWQYAFSNIDSETPGVILKSGRALLCADCYDVTYSYYIDGNIYIGSQVDFDAKISRAEEKLYRYPEGKKVKVYYDSGKPYYSTLEKKSLGAQIYGYWVMLAAMFILFFWIARI